MADIDANEGVVAIASAMNDIRVCLMFLQDYISPKSNDRCTHFFFLNSIILF